MYKASYISFIIGLLYIGGCAPSHDEELSTIAEALDRYDPVTAFQLIEEKRINLSDSSLMIACDIYELQALLIQNKITQLEKKTDEFHAASYSDKLIEPYQNKLLEISADHDRLSGKWEKASNAYIDLYDLASRNKNEYEKALFKIKSFYCGLYLGSRESSDNIRAISEIVHSLNDDHLLGEFYFYKYRKFEIDNQLDSTIIYLEKAEAHFQLANSIPQIITTTFHLANFLKSKGKFGAAYLQYKDGTTLIEEIGENYFAPRFLLELGKLSIYYREFDLARKYLKNIPNPDSMKLDLNFEYDRLSLMASLEREEGNYEKALTHSLAQLDLIEKHSGSFEATKYKIQYDIGKDYYHSNQTAEAMEYFQSAKDLLPSPCDDQMSHQILTWIARLQIERQPNPQTLSNCQKAFEYGLNSTNLSLEIDACECLYKYYHKISELHSALYYMEKYYQLKKIAFDRAKELNTEFLEIENTNKQNLLEVQLALQQQSVEAEKRQDELRITYSGIVFIVILSLTIVLAMLMRNRKKVAQNMRIANKNHEITTLNLGIFQGSELLKKQNQQLDVRLKDNLLLLANVNNLIEELQKAFNTFDIDTSPKKKILSLLKNHRHIEELGDVEEQLLKYNDKFISILLKRYPTLNSQNIKLCILVKLGLSNREISDHKRSSISSVKVAKSRLRKKLKIGSEISLSSFLSHIGDSAESDNVLKLHEN